MRGAKVRDALKWSGYIDEIIELFGDAEVYFGSHHWPIWGNERIIDFLEKQRDTYKYINDQSLRLALHGYTPREIAEELELARVSAHLVSQPGLLRNAQAQREGGLPTLLRLVRRQPRESRPPAPGRGRQAKYVELAGGATKLVENAQSAYDAGEYRWAAEVLNHLVFAEPDNADAKELLARAYDQLGYQAESGPWRDVYLTGAFELRHGGPDEGIDLASAMGMIKHAPLARFLDAMAARLNGPKAEGKEMIVNLVVTDIGVTHVLELKNSVLRHYERERTPRRQL